MKNQAKKKTAKKVTKKAAGKRRKADESRIVKSDRRSVVMQ